MRILTNAELTWRFTSKRKGSDWTKARSIEKNPGMHSLAKMMLNSFWDKFGLQSGGLDIISRFVQIDYQQQQRHSFCSSGDQRYAGEDSTSSDDTSASESELDSDLDEISLDPSSTTEPVDAEYVKCCY